MTENKWRTNVPREMCWFCARCHEPVRWNEKHGSVFTEVSNGDGEEAEAVLCPKCYNEFLSWFDTWLQEGGEPHKPMGVIIKASDMKGMTVMMLIDKGVHWGIFRRASWPKGEAMGYDFFTKSYIKQDENGKSSPLTAEDMEAEDWETIYEGIHRMTRCDKQ